MNNHNFYESKHHPRSRKKPKQLKKNLRKFKLDRDSNLDLCDDWTHTTLYPLSLSRDQAIVSM